VTPWSRYREIAYGILRWTPQAFREATIRDLTDGLAGYVEAHGASETVPKITREELEELKERYPDEVRYGNGN